MLKNEFLSRCIFRNVDYNLIPTTLKKGNLPGLRSLFPLLCIKTRPDAKMAFILCIKA